MQEGDLAQMIMDVDYADEIELPANTPAWAESLPHCLERAAGVIDLYKPQIISTFA